MPDPNAFTTIILNEDKLFFCYVNTWPDMHFNVSNPSIRLTKFLADQFGGLNHEILQKGSIW